MMRLPFRIHIARSSSNSAAPRGGVDERGRSTLSADERMFALGTRTLADLIAPAGVEVRRDHLQLDAQYVRALAVTGYPRTVVAGWLAPLVDELDLPLELSLHVRPLASATWCEPWVCRSQSSSHRAALTSSLRASPTRNVISVWRMPSGCALRSSAATSG